MMRLNVECELCGHNQKLQRRVSRPEVIHIICVVCESILVVDVTLAMVDDWFTASKLRKAGIPV